MIWKRFKNTHEIVLCIVAYFFFIFLKRRGKKESQWLDQVGMRKTISTFVFYEVTCCISQILNIHWRVCTVFNFRALELVDVHTSSPIYPSQNPMGNWRDEHRWCTYRRAETTSGARINDPIPSLILNYFLWWPRINSAQSNSYK